MKWLKAIVVALLTVVALTAAARAETPATGPARHIDLVLCLDTSNSMDGLINSAKQKLWAVVNELATAKPRPQLRVALYQYGNDNLDSKTGWVQKVSDLTDDLDAIYGKIFGLTTRGGTEYVARVIRDATVQLQWHDAKDTLRIIFVAGNEPATQDNQLKLEEVCSAAAGKGIIVNTIFCGPQDEGQKTGWADVARWADGKYASIDQDTGTVAVSTPYDKKLAELSTALNSTYVAYGQRGAVAAASQAAQDHNAVTAGAPAAAERAVAKAGGLYQNAGWDLVDAVQQKQVDLSKLPDEQLPENMRKLDAKDRQKLVAEQAAKRTELQKQIREVGDQRDKFVKEEMAKKSPGQDKSLDAALRSAVQTQAEAKGFQFQKQ